MGCFVVGSCRQYWLDVCCYFSAVVCVVYFCVVFCCFFVCFGLFNFGDWCLYLLILFLYIHVIGGLNLDFAGLLF